MFGTISHASLKPGQRQRLDELLDEWKRDIRPQIPGAFLELVGHKAGDPNSVVFVALARDEATYRNLASMPAQHEFYLRFNQVFTAEPTWEDVELDWHIRE